MQNIQGLLGKGPNGTELYVKIEEGKTVEEQFSMAGKSNWKELTLWFGDTEVTDKHTLGAGGTGNRYSLVERLGSGRYQLAGGEIVDWGNVGTKIKTGNYGYVALGDDEWRKTYNGASWLEFGKDSCRYQGNGVFKERDGTITVRCAYGNYWERDGHAKGGSQFVDLKLTKDDYVFLN